MKGKHIFCSMIICVIVLCSISTVTAIAKCSSTTASIIVDQSKSPPEITPFASDIGWKYKVINGVLYKRKYDFTRKQWIGPWIKA